MTTEPLNKTRVSSAAKKAADEIAERTRIAKALYNHHDTTRWNKTIGKLEDAKGDPIEPHEYLKEQKKLQNAADSLSPNMRDYYYDVSTNNFERRDNPPPHVSNSEREPKIHTPAYRRKYPERYAATYTPPIERALYPEAGTAPAEKAAVRKFINKQYKKDQTSISPKTEAKTTMPVIHYSPLRDFKQEAREAALEQTRVFAFTPRPNLDALKGIGSFMKTIGRKLKAANSKSDWEKRNQTVYEDNSDA